VAAAFAIPCVSLVAAAFATRATKTAARA